MQRALTVTGVLGAGTALVFAAAALASALFPNGSTIPAGWGNGVMMDRMIAPQPMPAVQVAPDVNVVGGADGGAVAPAPAVIEVPTEAPVLK